MLRLTFALPFVCVSGVNTQNAALQKVIELLGNMEVGAKKEKHEEEVMFAKYSTWCTNEKADLTEQTERHDAERKKQSSLKETKAAAKASLDEGIIELQGEMATWTKELNAAQKERDEEKAVFDKEALDYGESINALGRAIVVLQSNPASMAQKESLLQTLQLVGTKVVIKDDKKVRALTNFLQQPAGQAAAYEFSSQNVIDLLAELKDKFVDEKSKLVADETNAVHAFNQLKTTLTHQIGGAELSIEHKQSQSAEAAQAGAAAQAAEKHAAEAHAQTTKTLKETTATCKSKARSYNDRSQVRSKEIDAIIQALDTLRNIGKKEFIQKTSFIQLGLVTRRIHGGHIKEKSFNEKSFLQSTTRADRLLALRAFLKVEAKKMGGSPILMQVAEKVSEGPFDKVQKMVMELINRLTSEAASEATEKEHCDAMLKQNKEIREKRAENVEKKTAEKDLLKSQIAGLGEAIEEGKAEVTRLTTAIAELDANRGEEKKQFDQSTAESQEAQKGLQSAIETLSAVFSNPGAALLQQNNKDKQAPAIFGDEEFTGYGGMAGGNIVSMLEMLEGEQASLIVELRTTENSNKQNYNNEKTSLSTDKASQKATNDHNVETRSQKKQAMSDAAEDLVTEQESLDAANKEYEDLKPQCVASSSYEDRVGKRQQEIADLQQALKILQGEV